MAMKHFSVSCSRILPLLLCVLLLIGCTGNGNGDSSALSGGEKTTLSLENATPLQFYAQFHTYGQLELLTILPWEDGFALFTNDGHCQLSADFSAVESWKVSDGVDYFSVTSDGQALYSVKIAAPDGYGLYRNDEKLFDLPTDMLEGYQILPASGDVYAKQHTRIWSILYNGDPITAPTPPEDEQYNALGFWTLAGQNYLVSVREHATEDIDRWILQDVRLFPLNKGELGEPIILEGFTESPYNLSTDGTYGYFMLKNELYRTDGRNVESIGDLNYYGVDLSCLQTITPLPDGRILVVDSNALTVLTPGEEKEAQDMTTIRVACYPSITGFSKKAALYNREDGEHRLEIKVYETLADLNLALLSGEVDLLVSSDPHALRRYAARGILQPLDELIPDVLRSGELFSGVVQAGTVEDEVYFLPMDIRLLAMILPASVLEQYDGSFRDLEELQQCLDTLESQSFYQVQYRDVALNYFLWHGLPNWVDFEAGTCDFQAETFLWVLEHCNRYAVDFQSTQHSNDGIQPLFNPYYQLNDAVNLSSLDLQYEIKGTETPAYSESMAADVFSFPIGENSSLLLESDFVLAVASGSPAEEACGDFLNWIFAEETHEDAMFFHRENGDRGFSIYRDITDQYLKDAYSYLDTDRANALREEYLSLLENANRYVGSGADVWRVIKEEAQGYFAGDMTKEECARRIQERVSILLAEQG